MEHAGVWDGHTPHSSKRGVMQFEHRVLGMSLPVVAARACMKSVEVAKRYVDPYRQERQRQKTARAADEQTAAGAEQEAV